ncbi:MAG: tetratricopeptide repeat protein, partial [Candidatus Saccharimonadales bacterium]
MLKIRAELALGRYPDAQKTLEAALGRFQASIRLRWLGREVARYNGQPDRADALTDEIGGLLRFSSGRFRDPANQITLGRFFLGQGVDAKQVLDRIYNQLKQTQPNYIETYLASGELALDKQDYALAAEAFEQAAKLDPATPDAQFGLARAYAPSEPEKSQTAIEAALERNPHHVESLLLLVDDQVDSERYDKATETLQRIEAVNPEHPLLWAFRAVLAHLKNEPKAEQDCRQRALRWWPTNPAVDHKIGQKLSQKYRFAEGAAYQRRALEFDADYLPAKLQLAQDLLRLGDEDDGWPLADAVYGKDGYNVVAHNLVELRDHLDEFRTLEGDGFLLRMDPREAEIYGPRVLDLLQRAKTTLCAKYEVTIDEPVIVELFPRQQDFAIRTFGLPGGAGFLGVCFGRVITANSPASQGEHPSNWQATLWHEFCHVVTLHKTHNKMPRWLSEGISVYEERQADSTWGQSINPRYREMMLDERLTPVSQLSGAFLHPRTPLDLQFAYFESSLVVEYLVEKYGLDVLKRMLVDLGVGMPINDALARYAGSLEALDHEFAEYAHQQAAAMAPKADWSEPKVAADADAAELARWVEQHPNNYAGLRHLSRRLIEQKQWQAAEAPLKKMAELYPQDAGTGNPFAMLATVYRELGDAAGERAALEKLAELSADEVDAFSRLVELCSQAEDWESAEKNGKRLLAVN